MEKEGMNDRGRYFSIFAPRRSGKTTFFKETCRQLQNDPTYVAIILSFQDYQDLDKTQFYALIEKSLYKETFIEIVFDHVEYVADDEDQDWLEQYGLIKDKNGSAVVTNNIYKARFIKTFFKEVNAYREVSLPDYTLPGNRLDMKRILLDFNRYITQIGVNAFYQEKKPYEKTGKFLLTAWLYQFARSGEGELRHEVPGGLGRMDIILTYKKRKYIIETKVKRYEDINEILEEGITQLCGKYLATEVADEGYLVIFDTRTPVGAGCKPRVHQVKDYTVTSISIAIGRPKSF